MRIATCISAALVALSVPAMAAAADIAQLQVLGFSQDAHVFAFEEYGVQDGSGFPYSNIYFIDTEKDAYLPGTPYRVTIEDEDATLSSARSQAAQAAATLMHEHAIADNPGILAAFNPMSEMNVPPDELTYRTVQHNPSFGGAYTLKLEIKPFPIPERCENLTESYVGFKLRFTQQDGEDTDVTVYEDDNVPASRGCVSYYRLGGIALTGQNHGPHMALIEVSTFGFEGYDGRWIAVPVETLY